VSRDVVGVSARGRATNTAHRRVRPSCHRLYTVNTGAPLSAHGPPKNARRPEPRIGPGRETLSPTRTARRDSREFDRAHVRPAATRPSETAPTSAGAVHDGASAPGRRVRGNPPLPSVVREVPLRVLRYWAFPPDRHGGRVPGRCGSPSEPCPRRRLTGISVAVPTPARLRRRESSPPDPGRERPVCPRSRDVVPYDVIGNKSVSRSRPVEPNARWPPTARTRRPDASVPPPRRYPSNPSRASSSAMGSGR
jgi:hypothetical protein